MMKKWSVIDLAGHFLFSTDCQLMKNTTRKQIYWLCVHQFTEKIINLHVFNAPKGCEGRHFGKGVFTRFGFDGLKS